MRVAPLGPLMAVMLLPAWAHARDEEAPDGPTEEVEAVDTSPPDQGDPPPEPVAPATAEANVPDPPPDSEPEVATVTPADDAISPDADAEVTTDYGGQQMVPLVNSANVASLGRGTAPPSGAGNGDRGSRFRRGELSPYLGPKSESAWDWNISGYLRAPMRIGMNKRENPADGQSQTTWHAPIVPDDQYLTWQHTNHNPRDWAEIYFTFGNEWATGAVSVQGFNFTDAGFKEDGAQFGIAQGFVTMTPPLGVDWIRFRWRAGSFSNRYGMAGRYDTGEYDTYLFGRTHAMGETRTVEIDVSDWTLTVEHGFGATRPNPSSGNFARFTLLHHGHIGAKWDRRLEFNAHYLTSFSSEEDRIGETNLENPPDGRMTVIGPEVRWDGRQFGYYYVGYSYLEAKDALTVGPTIEVIHAKGGNEFNLGIVRNYLSDGFGTPSFGNGKVHTVLGQFEHSIRRIMSGDEAWWGNGRDLYLKVYGMLNKVQSDDPDVDGNLRVKYGADLNFFAMSWLSVALRYDRLQPNSKIAEQSFSIVSPRLEFRSEFLSHERISLQYSRYLYNQRECSADAPLRCVQGPPAPVLPDGIGSTTGNQEVSGNRGAPQSILDENVFNITASIWW